MKKKKWNRVLAVLLAMVTAVTLLSGCGGKSAEKKIQKQSRCIYGPQICMRNMHHTFRNSSRISMLNL